MKAKRRLGFVILLCTSSILAVCASIWVREAFTPTATPESLPPTQVITVPQGSDDVPMVEVPAGEFLMGSTYEDAVRWNTAWNTAAHERREGSTYIFADELPRLTVYLDTFEIDQVKVTHARYQRCVDAGVCTPSRLPGGITAALDSLPVTSITQQEAQTYCQWVGKRLPTEAEWEKAARGTGGLIYPWGNTWDTQQISLDRTIGRGVPYTMYVASGNSPYGARDMLSHIGEWVSGTYAPYPGGEFVGKVELEAVGAALFRGPGGHYYSGFATFVPELEARTARRGYYRRGSHPNIGFRCARGGSPMSLETAVIPAATPTPLATATAVNLEEMVLIPAGEFTMGGDDDAPERQIYVDAFYIDRYEVTESQYATFLNALGRHKWACAGQNCALIEDPSNIYDIYIQLEAGVYTVPEDYADYPIMYVSWYGAQAYCHWLGKQLPTEAQWEKAARGTDGRSYPWGDDWRPELEKSIRRRTHVGGHQEDISPYGVSDMLGNALEWVADWYSEEYPGQAPDRNPTGPPEPGERAEKVYKSGQNRGGLNFRGRVSSTAHFSGFRCVYMP